MFRLMSNEEVLSSKGPIASRDSTGKGSRFVVLLVSSKVFCSCVCLATFAVVYGHTLRRLTQSASLSPVSASRW